MEVRILDLDGSLPRQRRLLNLEPQLHDALGWGPRIRLACRFGRFRAFQRSLALAFGGPVDAHPHLTLYGSGDFHHVTLALLRRLPTPCNLLIVDKHPDWVQRLPFLHCGSWVAEALKLGNVRRVFHVGGELDFDNRYRWLAPWDALRSGRVVVFPAVRRFTRGGWSRIDHQPLRETTDQPLTEGRLQELLRPYQAELRSAPLYVSVDKDVMTRDDAVVNWDSGHLHLPEVETILNVFLTSAGGPLAGVDLVGDWSPVKVQGWFRRFLDLVEHEALAVHPDESTRRNESTNLALLSACGCDEPADDPVCLPFDPGERHRLAA